MDKTSIYTIDQGFNFREFKDQNRAKGTKKGIFLVQPAPGKIKNFIKNLVVLIKKHKNSKSLYNLTAKLNQKL